MPARYNQSESHCASVRGSSFVFSKQIKARCEWMRMSLVKSLNALPQFRNAHFARSRMTEKRRHDDRGVDGHRQQRPRPYNSREFSTSSSLSSRRFAVPRVHELSRQERVSLTQPHEIAYFSKYADEDVRFDRSNLVGTNLLDGVEEYTSKDESDPTAPPAPIAPFWQR
ncbi:hypothetical protein GQ600_7234 [Phytophthora cactorum]|nr:hypothetical protein GQ600_7234 [Phytophthora cactorum]